MKRDLIGTTLMIHQDKDQAFNLDTILLAHFTRVPYRIKSVLDFGTGSGALCLYLSQKTKAHITGIDVHVDHIQRATYNASINGLEHQITFMEKDIKTITQKDFNQIDVIVSNPPFFKSLGHHKKNDNIVKSIARHEIMIDLETLIHKASICLKYGGSFQMIHRPDRLSEIIDIAKKNHLEVKRIQMVHPYIDKKANHVLVEAIKYGKPGLVIEPPLILYHQKHEMTEALKKIYKGEAYAT